MADFLRDAFVANEFIVLSVEGQVFFVLGLGIAFQLWRESRLELAQHLLWLAAFGLLHAFYVWGGVFIPVQAGFLATPFVEALLLAQVLLLAASLACLFQFGMQTLEQPGGPNWRRFVVPIALATWIVWAIGPALYNAASAEAWHREASTWARYVLGFPGAIAAAIGLRSQAKRLTSPLRLPRIWRTLRAAGLALAGLSVAVGLVVPAGTFFPASVLNEERVFDLTIVPIEVYRAALGLVLMVAMMRAMDVFRTELDRYVAELQESEALAEERERFGRELHDGTLQVIYASGLLLRMTERRVEPSIAVEDRDRLREAIGLLDRAVTEIRQHLGQLQAGTRSQDLVAELRRLADEPYLRPLTTVSLETAVGDLPSIEASRVAHVVAVAREAVSNAVRHGDANQVQVGVGLADGLLTVTIADDGVGIPDKPTPGSGLRNMQDRARILGGTLTVAREGSRGTTVTLEAPLDTADRTKETTNAIDAG